MLNSLSIKIGDSKGAHILFLPKGTGYAVPADSVSIFVYVDPQNSSHFCFFSGLGTL